MARPDHSEALDLLAAALAEADGPVAQLDTEAVWEAVARAIATQLTDLDHPFLPVLGLGTPHDVDSRGVRIDGELWRVRPGKVRLFDTLPAQPWLHAPLYRPLAALDDWGTFIPREALAAPVARIVQPPGMPGLRDSLATLDWIIADYGGHDGGRLDRTELLSEIAQAPHIRLEHDREEGLVRLEEREGRSIESAWSERVGRAFACTLPWHPRAEEAVVRTVDWTEAIEPTVPAALAVALSCAPYFTLRRFVDHDYGLDTERLGLYFAWRDEPDRLVEFRDCDDRHLWDVAVAAADTLAVDDDPLRTVLHHWLRRCMSAAPIALPALGTLHRVELPALLVTRPNASPMPVDDEPQVCLESLTVWATTDRDDADWFIRRSK